MQRALDGETWGKSGIGHLVLKVILGFREQQKQPAECAEKNANSTGNRQQDVATAPVSNILVLYNFLPWIWKNLFWGKMD